MSVVEAASVGLKTKSRYKDETGKKFGSLTVISFNGTINRSAMWMCSCDCGKQVVRDGKLLRYGSIKSCGCQQFVGMRNARFKSGGLGGQMTLRQEDFMPHGLE